LKIRIFALAKELDMDSKLLIDFCAKAGITIKNSALASISPEERDRVLALIHAAEGGSSTAAQDDSVAPSREYVPEVAGKVRQIRTMTSRPSGGRTRPSNADIEAEQIPEEVPSDEPEVEFVDEGIEPIVAETPVLEEDVPESVDLVAEDVVETVSEITEPPAAPEAADEGGPQAPASPGPGKKLTRSDYVPASGTLRTMRNMQPMQARGTLDTSGAARGQTPAPAPAGGSPAPASPPPPAGAKKPPKKQQSAPLIAAIPEFRGPVAKPGRGEEQKAQKPEIRLSESILKGQSPLTDHMRKAAEKKKAEDDLTTVRRDGRRVAVDRNAGMGLEESRAQRRDRRRQTTPVTAGDEEGDRPAVRHRPLKQRRRGGGGGTIQFKSSASVELPITVRSLSEAMGRPAKQILQILFQQGEMLNINSPLEEDEAIELAMELGVDLTIDREADLEEILEEEFARPDEPDQLSDRPPIITILGHVDHGKTTLIDRLRSSNVAAGEFGGITQHIAAYQVEHNGKKLTFVDTPGHAAFGEMRARGANVTDIVVLVVAANDGVMPQTVECISHARAAGVPLVVAMNKVDLPDRNEQKVLQDLAQHNVLASEWGGDIEVVRTSGLSGQGVDDLLDTLLLTAELHEYRGNTSRDASGVCLESFRDEGRGPIAWMIVRNGTLRIGDVVLVGEAYGRVRMLYDERDREVTEAGPSTPVRVAGLDIVPKAGDKFYVLPDLEIAREIAEKRRVRDRVQTLANRGGRRTLDDILQAAREGEVQDLNVIVKADTPGSLEALRGEVGKFEHPEVRVKILHDGVGGVNESDVYLAAASDAIIVAFHVIAEDRAQQLAQAEGVEIRRYNIIYEVIDEIRQTLEGMLRPEKKEITTGRAIVLRVFNISKFGSIAGCRVLNGTIERSNRIHLIRDQKVMNNYGIGSLRREKDDVKEVREGMECGIRLENFSDVKEGDLFEAYRIEEVRRTLDS
jgi:translation initiation factor IF-2